MNNCIHRNPIVFPPSPCSSVGRPSERQTTSMKSQRSCHLPSVSVRHKSALQRQRGKLYLPRPAMPLSSLGSKVEERCENAAVRSEAVWTGAVVEVAVGAEGAGGCGLRSPVKLSSGTGVMDAEVTSLVLTWGFKWFLLQRGEKAKMISTNLKIHFKSCW